MKGHMPTFQEVAQINTAEEGDLRVVLMHKAAFDGMQGIESVDFGKPVDWYIREGREGMPEGIPVYVLTVYSNGRCECGPDHCQHVID